MPKQVTEVDRKRVEAFDADLRELLNKHNAMLYLIDDPGDGYTLHYLAVKFREDEFFPELNLDLGIEFDPNELPSDIRLV